MLFSIRFSILSEFGLKKVKSEKMEKLITSIVPANNEEKNILLTIDRILSAFKEFNLNGEVLVINDGSVDSTPQLVEKKMKENPNVRIIHHDRRKGIGASFWDGVDNAKGNFVVMIPGDNENDPRGILRYHQLLEQVDIVVPFVFNKEVRSFSRNFLSALYLFIINVTFSTKFNYTNGTILYRKSILKELDYRNNGFFFQADILIRIVKKGYLFAEVPYRLEFRKGGDSKIISVYSFLEIMRAYLHLVKDYYFKNKIIRGKFSSDSMTNIRKK